MYNQKLIASLKANGKILREYKDTVYCPFGQEYSILLKNLNTFRAVVHVYIDGEDMIPDGLVLNAGQEVDLERSIKNGNLNEGNRFKFIERTGKVEQHRGVKLEDGIVRIEYQFEMPRPIINIRDNFRYTGIGGSSTGDYYGPTHDVWCSTNISGSTGASYSTNSVLRSQTLKSVSATSATMDSYVPQNEAGITVPGSKSEQKFQTTTMGALDPQKYSIVLKILGETPDNEPVRKPITTKHKPKCVTCGKQNKATAKFCTECGTALEIFA
jgi:zinc-ribbon domain